MNVVLKARPTLHHVAPQGRPPCTRIPTRTLTQTRPYTPPPITPTDPSQLASARAHCSSLLRKFDAPSYTLQTFIPPRARDAYLALRSYNIDVARIADSTSNAQIAALRCQFWRDAVSQALALNPPKEPVAVLLASAARDLHERTEGRSALSRGWLHRVISAREKYLQNPPYPTISDVEAYAENTYSTLLYLTLQALPMASVEADHVASHIGKAQGIVALLRGLPLLAFPPPGNHHSNQVGAGQDLLAGKRQGTVALPLDVMAGAGVRETDVLRQGGEAKRLRDAVFEVATRASDHLITAREMCRNLREGKAVGHDFEHGDDAERAAYEIDAGSDGKSGMTTRNADIDSAHGVFMPAISTQLWLDKLQKYDFDVFEPKLRTTDWRLPLKAYWAYSRRRI